MRTLCIYCLVHISCTKTYSEPWNNIPSWETEYGTHWNPIVHHRGVRMSVGITILLWKSNTQFLARACICAGTIFLSSKTKFVANETLCKISSESVATVKKCEREFQFIAWPIVFTYRYRWAMRRQVNTGAVNGLTTHNPNQEIITSLTHTHSHIHTHTHTYTYTH